MYVNHYSVTGNLAADPELKSLPDGTPVLNFRIGNSSPFKKGDKRTTTWFNVSAFGKTATNLSTRLSKGMQVFVEGELSARETEYNGKNRTFLDIRSTNVQMVGAGGAASAGGSGDYAESQVTDYSDDNQDVPF